MPTEEAHLSLHAGLRGLDELRRSLAGFGGLPCFVLCHWPKRGGLIEWWELHHGDRRLRPYDFEFKFGLAERRDAYHRRNLAEVTTARSHVIGELYGFRDLYVPLGHGRDWTLAFYVGQWSPCLPTYDQISQTWQHVSGRAAGSSDPLFRRWFRCCLEVPVLTRARVADLMRLGRELGRLFDPVSASTSARSIARLRRQRFQPTAVDFSWVSSALDMDGVLRPPWGLDARLDARLTRDLGLQSRPTLLGLLAPSSKAREEAEPLRHWVTERLLQIEATRVALLSGACIAAPLGQSEVLLAIALDPGLQGLQRRRKATDTVRRIQVTLEREARLKTVAGLGLEVLPGEGLGESYRQAALALVQAIERKEPLRCYDGQPGVHVTRVRELRLGAESLVQLLAARRLDAARIEAQRLAQAALAEAAGEVATLRTHLLLILDRTAELLQSERILEHSRAADFAVGQAAALAHAQEPVLLLELFELEFGRSIQLLQAGTTADRDQRLAQALDWVRKNLGEPDLVYRAAKRAGLAVPSFRRAFRRAQGQAFGRWLRELKLDGARRLLCQTALSVDAVSKRFGFGEVHAFIRCFRRAYGVTPGAYRRDQAASLASRSRNGRRSSLTRRTTAEPQA